MDPGPYALRGREAATAAFMSVLGRAGLGIGTDRYCSECLPALANRSSCRPIRHCVQRDDAGLARARAVGLRLQKQEADLRLPVLRSRD
jgi:hypothetical protein